MIPTFYGPSVEAHCVKCLRCVRVDPLSASYTPQQKRCSLCGAQLEFTADTGAGIPGDIVDVTPLSESPGENELLKIGDIVAIKVDDQLRVKRIAALPGDIVDVDEQRMTINGQRLDDKIARRDLNRAPRLLVDDDSIRNNSRWASTQPKSAWRRSDRQWCRPMEATSNSKAELDWLAYRHVDVRKGDRPSCVLDDCQFNTGVVRALNDADRLILLVRISDDRDNKRPSLAMSPVEITVAFYDAGQVRLATQKIESLKRSLISFHHADAIDRDRQTPELDATMPIAIAVSGSGFAIDSLHVMRHASYRSYPSHQVRLPLKLVPGQCFVIGDNESVSVDSRTTGPIPRENVAGTVSPSAPAF